MTEPSRTLPRTDQPFPITCELFERMVESGVIPRDRRVYLWDGSLIEKMAKSRDHAAVQAVFTTILARRLPEPYYVGPENPVRLDATHVPLPDLIVLRENPLRAHSTRYPDGRDVLLVVEISVTSLPEDLGPRLARYASCLPLAGYVVADVPGRRILVHSRPIPAQGDQPGKYESVQTVTAGGRLQLTIDGIALDPIPYEQLLPQ
ncbi:MAG: Uma2 family endonuclease [Isosphaeraceae bacterium]